MSVTALALVGATAVVPASATTSARSIARVLASTCDPSSGTRAYYSYGGNSNVNAKLCVEVLQRADGTKALQVHYNADIQYQWALTWYSDCKSSYPCFVKGGFTLQKSAGGRTWDFLFDHHDPGVLTAKNVHATTTFNVDSGRWRVVAAMEKTGGYWRFNRGKDSDTGDLVRTNGLTVAIDVP
ncbi:MAG TPA: hypothetical protein VM347_27365 [Nonomuraea sp.]|nr:hypothetical protein [Nonomuraea sp.]